jgi:putative acetyltransferase
MDLYFSSNVRLEGSEARLFPTMSGGERSTWTKNALCSLVPALVANQRDGTTRSSDAKIGCVLPPDQAVIRCENTGDRSTVRSINEAAFGRQDEADLVERLWSQGVVLASLVAEVRRQVVGHILFSRMSIDTARASIPAVALAPMAVLPEYQRQAIGGQLIRGGLDLLCGQGEQIVLVLGHPNYYPRFGFSAEMARCLESPFPPNAFMAMEFVPTLSMGFAAKSGIRLRSDSEPTMASS